MDEHWILLAFAAFYVVECLSNLVQIRAAAKQGIKPTKSQYLMTSIGVLLIVVASIDSWPLITFVFWNAVLYIAEVIGLCLFWIVTVFIRITNQSDFVNALAEEISDAFDAGLHKKARRLSRKLHYLGWDYFPDGPILQTKPNYPRQFKIVQNMFNL